jgi:hypothetical protein
MGAVQAFVPAALAVANTVVQAQQANRTQKAQADQVAAQNRMLEQQQRQREKQQRDLLARQLATARARLSAGGGGADGGSGLALLSGLTRRSEEDLADAALLTRMRQTNAGNSLGASSASGLEKALSLYQDAGTIYGRLPNP